MTLPEKTSMLFDIAFVTDIERSTAEAIQPAVATTLRNILNPALSYTAAISTTKKLITPAKTATNAKTIASIKNLKVEPRAVALIS